MSVSEWNDDVDRGRFVLTCSSCRRGETKKDGRSAARSTREKRPKQERTTHVRRVDPAHEELHDVQIGREVEPALAHHLLLLGLVRRDAVDQPTDDGVRVELAEELLGALVVADCQSQRWGRRVSESADALGGRGKRRTQGKLERNGVRSVPSVLELSVGLLNDVEDRLAGLTSGRSVSLQSKKRRGVGGSAVRKGAL